MLFLSYMYISLHSQIKQLQESVDRKESNTIGDAADGVDAIVDYLGAGGVHFPHWSSVGVYQFLPGLWQIIGCFFSVEN